MIQKSFLQYGPNGNLISSLWPRIESELEHEIGVKDREVEWLCKIGSDIQPRLTEDQQPGKYFGTTSVDRSIYYSLFNIGSTSLDRLGYIRSTIAKCSYTF